jgi:hypothetical protein
MNRIIRTAEKMRTILRAIEIGATHRIAAMSAGVSERTLKQWTDEDPEFREQVDIAESKSAIRLLAKVEQAANNGDWKAAAWKLERRFPQEYGKQIIEQTGQVDYVIDIGIRKEDRPALNDDGASTKLLVE